MSTALIITHKTLGGHKWSNTHCVIIGASGNASPPSDADLDSIGCNVALTDANTSSAPSNFIQRLIAFERRMHQPDVLFTDVYVTDGIKNTVGTGFTQYATLSMSLAGLGVKAGSGVASGNFLEVGGVTLLVHRSIAGYGHKPGRLFLRGVLHEGEVTPTGPRMIDWFDTTSRNTNITLLTTALNLGLNTHLLGGTNAAVATYALPIYSKGVAPNIRPKGSLEYSYPINALAVVGPVIRQVQRGRKRKKVTA